MALGPVQLQPYVPRLAQTLLNVMALQDGFEPFADIRNSLPREFDQDHHHKILQQELTNLRVRTHWS